MFPQEPESNSDEFQSPLRGLDNVMLTPHIGGSTAEAQEAIGVEVAEKLLTYSNNGSTLSAVNFPEVALPGHPGQAPRCCTSTTTGRACCRASTTSSPSGGSTSRRSTCRPARASAMSSSTSTRIRMPIRSALRRELASLDGTIKARVLY